MTYGDIQLETPISDRIYYVYVWYYKSGCGEKRPFYVGMGKTERRWKDKSCRSRAFKEFVKSHDCFSEKVVDGLAFAVAIGIERQLKIGFIQAGYEIIDAENDMKERARRQAEGIAAMPVVDGKRVSGKTGRPVGRPLGEYPDFQKFFKMQKGGSITVEAACKEMGISRSQWYNLSRKKKIGLPSAKSTSRSEGQTPKDGADTQIVSCAS